MKLWYEIKRAKRLLKPSPAEMRFLKLMGYWWRLRYRVRREYKVGGYVADFAIPSRCALIEIDGRRYHDVVSDWERDTNLRRKGWVTLRIPASDLHRQPKEVKRRVKDFLR